MIIYIEGDVLCQRKCFRLLNSEIGNDPVLILTLWQTNYCFRLLNSEIGNDLLKRLHFILTTQSFRLLNSEIGNDPKFTVDKNGNVQIVFVSLIRR